MKNVTRRSALGLFVAAGGATLLAACGSQSQATGGSASASGSASTSDAEVNNARADYSGAAVLDGYTSKPADYQLATRTEPAKNVPVPTKPAVANENSVEGLYQSIAFFGAAMEYYMRTGKTELLRESAMDKSELKSMLEPEDGTLGEKLVKGEVWMHDPTVTITLLSAQPTRDGKAYTWNVRFTLTRGEFMASKDKVLEVPESGRENVNERTLRGVYENGAWKLTGMKSDSEASASASASAS